MHASFELEHPEEDSFDQDGHPVMDGRPGLWKREGTWKWGQNVEIETLYFSFRFFVSLNRYNVAAANKIPERSMTATQSCV